MCVVVQNIEPSLRDALVQKGTLRAVLSFESVTVRAFLSASPFSVRQGVLSLSVRTRQTTMRCLKLHSKAVQ